LADPAPYLAMRGIAKSYPGVRALDGVDFDVRSGEVHALVGENGAGKSTLMKILAGATAPDTGEIDVEGKRVVIASPRDAEKLRIAIIYQEFNLVPSLDVAANVLLGHEPVRAGVLDYPALYSRAGEVFSRLAVSVPLHSEVRLLSVAQQQMVEIAKALSVDARVIVMDEPSASLTPDEVAKLFDVIRTLTRAGVAVVYISHRMEEIFTIADRITVLRDGKLVGPAARRALSAARNVRSAGNARRHAAAAASLGARSNLGWSRRQHLIRRSAGRDLRTRRPGGIGENITFARHLRRRHPDVR
jgi:ribose transport system ATP-binding protein